MSSEPGSKYCSGMGMIIESPILIDFGFYIQQMFYDFLQGGRRPTMDYNSCRKKNTNLENSTFDNLC